MTSRVVIDTNVLLLLFFDENPAQGTAIQAWLQRAFTRRDPELILVPTVLTELVTAFRRNVPPRTHPQILDALEALLDMPFRIESREIVEAAVELYRGLRARDWEDCVIAAYATARSEGRLATYDRSLASLPGIVAIAP